MGGCISFSAGRGGQVTERDRLLHSEVERQLLEAKAKLDAQIKVLVLGSGGSGKSAILQRMRLIHRVSYPPQETESFRKLVFANLTQGLKYLLDALPDMMLELPAAYTNVDPETGWVRGWGPGEGGAVLRIKRGEGAKVGIRGEEIATDVELVTHAKELCDGEAFPMCYYGPLSRLWNEEVVRMAWNRGSEVALPDNLDYFFSGLDRFFDPAYVPSEQDIARVRVRTVGITETSFRLRDHEMVLVDVEGQKSERRKWIHCFQDVTAILFIVNLSGYDQCLVEDRDANQMQDAFTIWDSICHSQWFKNTSIILFLNHNDLFEEKIKTSDIRDFFPDFDGEPRSALAGRDYFKKRFGRLAQKAGRAKEREIYIHVTTEADPDLFRMLTAAVEDIVMRSNISRISQS